MNYKANYNFKTDELTITLDNGKRDRVRLCLVSENQTEIYQTPEQRLSNATTYLLSKLK